MSKKKLEVVELDKKNEEIVLKEKQNKGILFWKRHRKLIFLTLLLLSLATSSLGIYSILINVSKLEQPNIKEVSVDTSLTDYLQYVTGGEVPITEETAKNSFLNDNKFASKGETLLVNTVETGTYVIRFYSDGSAIKVLKKSNVITRISALEDGNYGISADGVINSNAVTLDVTITKTSTFSWGVVTYYSDGSAEISDSKMDMFVRNSQDINDNYISDNKVSYLKETKTIGNIKLNYFHDGTIEVIKNNKSYLVRSSDDLDITNNNVSFKNNNQAQIIKTITDGMTIDYYDDGSAIIRDGTHYLSVRKSNSIVLKDNKVFEIVDNIYVTVTKEQDNGNIIYYSNGGAVINYNGNYVYVYDNSDIKYQNGKIVDIGNNYETIVNSTNINNEKIQTFEKIAVVKTNDYIAIVQKDNLIYSTDGTLKEILTNQSDTKENEFTVTNNTNERIKYRVVIEETTGNTLDVQYIRYQLSTNGNYSGVQHLNGNIWNSDSLSEQLNTSGTNYILIDSTLEAYATANIRLMLWTDYDTIPNSMQNKYFYGTIRIYSWKEI